MSGIGRRLAAWLAVAGLLLVFPASISATISGGCTAEGHASGSAGADLTVDPVWHLKSSDVVGGSGQSTATMTSATLSAYALGLAIPIVNGSGNGDTTGSVDDISLETFSKLGKVFVVAGHATGGGTCDGQVLIILDDVDALFTVLGGGGLIVFVLGIGAALLTGRGGGCLSKLFALVFGGLAATGLALSMEQFEIISPTSPVGIVIVLVGAILGFLVAVRLGPPGMPKPPAEPAVAGTMPSGSATQAAVDNIPSAGGDVMHPPEPTVTGTVSSPPTVADVMGPADPLTPSGGPTPDDVAKGAVDVMSGDVPPVPGPGEPASMDYATPPDPNAPGVDVGEPPPTGPIGPDGRPAT